MVDVLFFWERDIKTVHAIGRSELGLHNTNEFSASSDGQKITPKILKTQSYVTLTFLTQGLKPCLNINCKKEGAKILIHTQWKRFSF